LDGPPYHFPIGEAAVYCGLTVDWRTSEKLFILSRGTGARGRLLLGDPYLYLDSRRLRIDAPFGLALGTPAADATALRGILQELAPSAPQWSEASPQDTAGFHPAQGAAPESAPTPSTAYPVVPPPKATEPAHVAARPLSGGKVRTIVIDAGHGGYDPGAHGPRGTLEKDVCLDIALKLRRELNFRDPRLQVRMTRDKDEFISLSERTVIANDEKGDLFVSIHNNASPNSRTHGTQVFFFDSQSSDKAAADLTMRENGQVNQLDVLMTDLAKSLVRDQSIAYAKYIQNAMGVELNLKHRDISYAPFYVLARTQMPAILVEVAFITNPREELQLRDDDFQSRVARSIAVGVEDYIRYAEARP
jgi:N-acetylmuramoyl-L-alanine amidase